MSRPKPRLRGIPHLIAAVIALPAGYLLVQAAQAGAFTDAASIYSASYSAYLGAAQPITRHIGQTNSKARLRVVDHTKIYVLIAGSYVPYLTTLGEAAPTWLGPAVIAGAFAGILQTVFWSNAPRMIRTVAYVLLGCGAVFSCQRFTPI